MKDRPVTHWVTNVTVWCDGTIRPAKGHNGMCKWFFDGQFWYHIKDEI